MRFSKALIVRFIVTILLTLAVYGCETPTEPLESPALEGTPVVDTVEPLPTLRSRHDTIPNDSVKMNPETDPFPPQLHSTEWKEPVPVPGHSTLQEPKILHSSRLTGTP